MKKNINLKKFIYKVKDIWLFILEILKKMLKTTMSKFRLAIVLLLVIKSKIFIAIIETNTADKLLYSNFTFKCIFIYLAIALIFYSFGYLLSKNKQIVYYVLLDVLYSILLVGDIWYYRVNNDFLGLKNIFFRGTFNPMGESLLNFRPIDIIFVVDIIFIIGFIFIKKLRNNEERKPWKCWFVIRYCISFLAIAFFLVDVLSIHGWSYSMLTTRWTTLMSSRATGPMGYHVVEATKTISKVLTSSSVPKNEKKDVDNWIEENKEDIEPNEYAGVFKGKNVLFLQIESLENFVINKKTNGKEITPFLNKLTREGLYFNNIYQQNNAGNSIDCDFLVNTSVYPLGGITITALNYGEKVYSNSLPRILKSEGYETITTHAEENDSFNWNELHKNCFGVDKLWDITKYDYDETVGYGLSDRSFYTQVANKLQDEEQPFFLQMPTLSNHGPFDIDKIYRTLDLPPDVDQSYLGGYFESVAYSDRQIEMMFNKLDNEGLLDNTVVVIYGDHAGVHKYYNDDIQNLDYEDGWWKEYDQKIPLIIYSKDVKPKVVEAAGGQVDILPTLCYLMGIDKEKYENTSMGRVLVNTNRNATVIKGNEIVGQVSSEEEKEHLLKAYQIGEIIIKRDLFNKK